MVKETITVGTQITSNDGYIVCESYGSRTVYATEYITDDNGNVTEEQKRMYTLEEIGLMMRECDGRCHKVSWEDPEPIIRVTHRLTKEVEVEGTLEEVKAYLDESYEDCDDIYDLEDVSRENEDNLIFEEV